MIALVIANTIILTILVFKVADIRELMVLGVFEDFNEPYCNSGCKTKKCKEARK